MNSKQKNKAKSVDTYLSEFPTEFRNALQTLRAIIRTAAPEAEEGFSYGVPAFLVKGKPLVCYAAFKNHCGFYPMSPAVLKTFSAELAGYETAKGTIRFHPDKPVTAALVKRIVKARIAEIQGK